MLRVAVNVNSKECSLSLSQKLIRGQGHSPAMFILVIRMRRGSEAGSPYLARFNFFIKHSVERQHRQM